MFEKIKSLPPFVQVVVLFFIGLITFVLLSMIGSIVVSSYYPDLSLEDSAQLQKDYPSLYMLLFFAPFQVGVLLIPALLYWYKIRSDNMVPKTNLVNMVWCGLLFIAVVLLLPLFSELNHVFTKLFGVFDTLYIQKETADETLKEMISYSNLSFWMGILIIGVITGISEEFAFRGFIQHHIYHHTHRLDLAIFGSALVFALLHFNYFQFIPLFIFGIALAMIFHLTQSLWPGIVLHATNNIMNVYWLKEDSFPIFLEEINLTQTIPSVIMLMGLLYFKRNDFNL